MIRTMLFRPSLCAGLCEFEFRWNSNTPEVEPKLTQFTRNCLWCGTGRQFTVFCGVCGRQTQPSKCIRHFQMSDEIAYQQIVEESNWFNAVVAAIGEKVNLADLTASAYIDIDTGQLNVSIPGLKSGQTKKTQQVIDSAVGVGKVKIS